MAQNDRWNGNQPKARSHRVFISKKTVILQEGATLKRDDHYPSSHFEFLTFLSFCGSGFFPFALFCSLRNVIHNSLCLRIPFNGNQSDRSSGLNPLEDYTASNDSVGFDVVTRHESLIFA